MSIKITVCVSDKDERSAPVWRRVDKDYVKREEVVLAMAMLDAAGIMARAPP